MMLAMTDGVTHPETGRALAGTGATDTTPAPVTHVTQTTPAPKMSPRPASPTPIISGAHFTSSPILLNRTPVAIPTNNPTAGSVTPAGGILGSLALPTTSFYTNLAYPVIAFIIGALILTYVLKQKG